MKSKQINMADETKCDVCKSNIFKYKCPRCEIKSCSLDCVNIHKKELECDGERQRASYIPLSKYNNLTLLNDYRFLEDVSRTVDSCKRNPQKRYTRFQQPLPTHLYRLKSAAIKRGIKLQFLPQHFTKHKENGTKLNYTTQLITWKIDFIFPQADFIKISETCDETKKLISVLYKYLNPKECPDIYKNHLKFYHARGVSDLEALLEAERVSDKNTFFSADLSLSVSENLENRQIIEYPTFYIIQKAFRHEYNIVDADESIQAPFDVLHGKRSGFFGDFTPLSFYKSLEEPEKKTCVGEEAAYTIKNCAKKLRTYNTDSDEGRNKQRIMRERKNFVIPNYEEL